MNNIGIYEYLRIKIFMLGFRCWIWDVWYNRKLKLTQHNKGKLNFLCILKFVWTIWAISLLDFLVHRLDFFSDIFVSYSYQKTIQMNIRIYIYFVCVVRKPKILRYMVIFLTGLFGNFSQIIPLKKWQRTSGNTSFKKKMFSFGHCPNEGGGPWPN